MAKTKTRYRGVYQLVKNVKYEIDFKLKGMDRVQRTILASSSEEANKKRASMISEASIPLVAGHDRRQSTFDVAFDKVKEGIVALPTKTQNHYINTYKRLFVEFRALRFSHVTNFTHLSIPFFVEYRGWYASKKPRGIRAEMIFVNALMSRFAGLGYFQRDILETLREEKKPKAVRKEFPHLSKTDLDKLLVALKNESMESWYVCKFMAGTGRRVNECCSIELTDTIFQGLRPTLLNIRIETTKMDEKAPLEIDSDQFSVFIADAYRQAKKVGSKYLFPNRLVQKNGEKVINRSLKKVSKEILGVALTTHFFRHQFLTAAGNHNMPLADVMRISGLRDVKILVKYYTNSTKDGRLKIFSGIGIF